MFFCGLYPLFLCFSFCQTLQMGRTGGRAAAGRQLGDEKVTRTILSAEHAVKK
jgi:hypothetical protein